MANSELSATALEELSSQIQSNSKTLINHLQHEDQLQSSVEDDARVGADVQKLDSVTEIHRLQNLLKQDALKLFRLASGPSEYIAHIALNVIISQSNHDINNTKALYSINIQSASATYAISKSSLQSRPKGQSASQTSQSSHLPHSPNSPL